MDSQRQDFWKEAILKEKQLRLNWFRDNWTRHPKTTKKERRVKLPQVVEPSREARPVEVTSTVATGPTSAPRQRELLSTDIMRPVSGETKAVLYQGFSKEETGRYKYLLLRKRQNPEEKYPYPITSNWQYGWGLGDMTKAYVPMHALNAIVRESFFRKNGIFPRTSPSDTVA